MKLIEIKSYKATYDIDRIFKSWAICFQEFTFTNYFKNLMGFIRGMYLLNIDRQNMLPKRRVEVFKTFRRTDFSNLKVVIIGGLPYDNASDNNGIPYSNSKVEFRHAHPALSTIASKVEETCYSGLNLGFDYTLRSWQDQGVLILNTALTCEKTRGYAHITYWKEFLRNVLEQIDKQKEGIIFCFWGEEAKKFAYEIDLTYHFVLFSPAPEFAIYADNKWDCNHFEKVNSILEREYGKKSIISW